MQKKKRELGFYSLRQKEKNVFATEIPRIDY